MPADDLAIASSVDGLVVRHVAGSVRPRAHRHAELEVDLVVRGRATYLLRERRYELTPGTLTWLFPGQDHVLVEESDDHELWWAVFRPSLVARTATGPQQTALLDDDPPGEFSRRLTAPSARRLRALLEELHAGAKDPALLNAGLPYLLMVAWRAFLDSDDVVIGADVHPAVAAVARRLRTNPHAGDLTELAAEVGLSPAHLSRLFKAQTGRSISRFRNRERVLRFVAIYGDGDRTTALAAALDAGFGSYAQFHRAFRAEIGSRPSSLRVAPLSGERARSARGR